VEENAIPKRVIYMNLETTVLRVRPRNRWQDEVRENGRIVGGEGWQYVNRGFKVVNQVEIKKTRSITCLCSEGTAFKCCLAVLHRH